MGARTHSSPNELPGSAVPTTGDDTTCPLCHKGSREAQHYMIFCDVVHEAWTTLGGKGSWVMGSNDADVEVVLRMLCSWDSLAIVK